jgi:prevent-host-death family protein
MLNVGAIEASAILPDLLDRVANGEQITIVDQGIPVAMLVPVQRKSPKSVDQAIREILEFRRGKTLGGLSHRNMIEEGRA